MSRIVEVTWVDSAAGTQPWMGKDESLVPCTAVSVGYLHQRKKGHIVLVQSIGETQVGNVLAIPRVAIVKMRTIKR